MDLSKRGLSLVGAFLLWVPQGTWALPIAGISDTLSTSGEGRAAGLIEGASRHGVDTSALTGVDTLAAVVPEPTSLGLFAMALIGLGIIMRRRPRRGPRGRPSDPADRDGQA